MNSPLEHDFDGFDFSTKTDNINEQDTKTGLQIIESQISIVKPVDVISENLPQCEICTQKFLSKKELRSHITIHLGEPRIILKRCNSEQEKRRKDKEKYSKNSERKGGLKLTLKKKNHSDFAVINRDIDFKTENSDFEEVADADGNEKDFSETSEEEQSTKDSGNVMVDGEETFENVIDNDNDVEGENSSDDNEKATLETNEGDSGVGSDMANPSEKEDQTVDDTQSSENYESSEQEKNIEDIPEIEDPEDSDALEATCRETIENLRKLGQETNSRASREKMSPREDDEISEKSSPISTTINEPELSIFPKNTKDLQFNSLEEDLSESDKEKERPQNNSGFNWSRLTERLSKKDQEELNKEVHNSPDEEIENTQEDTGNLLKNFLIDQQKKNQNDTANNSLPVETEYVSLERLAETVNTCRVCNEKFRDITLLDEHKSKVGHYQCNVPDCSNHIFSTSIELSAHKSQAHGAPLSPSINQLSHVTRSSPHLSEGSPRMGHNSPHLLNHSPRETDSGNSQIPRTSVRNQVHSPSHQGMIPPINLDQLPAPVQQLAQQVQRMPLPQTNMSSSLPPGVNTMIPGPNYFVGHPGRPPMYRGPGPPPPMYNPPQYAHLYGQYGHGPGPGPYMGYPGPPQMHPQIPQQMPRRYPTMIQPTRPARMPQQPIAPRQRMKRPMPTQPVQQRPDLPAKQRRMEMQNILLPDRNEDADCHVIVQQKRNDGLPVIQNVQGASSQQSNRNDSTIHLTDSITLSVRQPAQPQNSPSTAAKKTDAKAVANVLAARGITVTPAANKNKIAEQQKQQQSTQQQQQQQQQRPSAPAQPAVNVAALNLNSAISIIPASTQRKQQQQQQQQQQGESAAQFAVPQNKQSKTSPSSDVERPPRPPTVDLTQDVPLPPPNPLVRRGRPPRSAVTCQICDKRFASDEVLSQHMVTHRGTNKLIHKCNLCPAQYPAAQALLMHKQTYHKEVDTITTNGGTELAIPVIDLKSPQVLNRLSSLGIQSYIPLSQLSAQTGGYFGLPIITIDGPRNSNSCNLGALGATSILSLGPLKHLSNR